MRDNPRRHETAIRQDPMTRKSFFLFVLFVNMEIVLAINMSEFGILLFETVAPWHIAWCLLHGALDVASMAAAYYWYSRLPSSLYSVLAAARADRVAMGKRRSV
jgi:hypothetical protein